MRAIATTQKEEVKLKRSIEKSKNNLQQKRKNCQTKILQTDQRVYNNCFKLPSRAINKFYSFSSALRILASEKLRNYINRLTSEVLNVCHDYLKEYDKSEFWSLPTKRFS